MDNYKLLAQNRDRNKTVLLRPVTLADAEGMYEYSSDDEATLPFHTIGINQLMMLIIRLPNIFMDHCFRKIWNRG